MAGLHLRDGLSYCEIDGHLIFMDTLHDRYFRLSRHLESRFVGWVDGDRRIDSGVRTLVARGVFAAASDDSPLHAVLLDSPATCSALEVAAARKDVSLSSVIGCASSVVSTQIRLQSLTLKRVLESLATYRSKHLLRVPAEPSQSEVMDCTHAFLHARPYVPVESCCLLDSISLIRFMARRGVCASLVFGVTASPFSAHCWVMHGSMVLNDTLGHACAHTPIRVM